MPGSEISWFPGQHRPQSLKSIARNAVVISNERTLQLCHLVGLKVAAIIVLDQASDHA